MQMKKFYEMVRAEMAKLSEEWPYIMSIDGPNSKAGTVVQVDRKDAATRIVEGSHRVATPEEVDQEKARESAAAAEYAEQERRRNKPQVLQLPVEIVDAIMSSKQKAKKE